MRARRILCLFTASLLAAPFLVGCSQQDSAPAPDAAEKIAAGAHGAGQSAVDARIKFNWQMNCQGCHHPDGAGNPARDIPRLAALEKFQRTQEGREFLIRVPGMSRSALPDEDLTELANWMMGEFATPGAEHDWEPYTLAEVRDLRQRPIVDGVVEHRKRIVSEIEGAGG